MDIPISQEEFTSLMALKGEVRGVAFKTQADFILKEKGEKGLEKVEYALKKLGYPFKLRETNSMDFYPIGLVGSIQLIVKNLFLYSEKDMERMGAFESKVSFIVRLFMRYFVSLDTVEKVVPEMWRKYYTIGDLKVSELNKQKRKAVLRLENFKIHKTHCQDLAGYFSSILQMIVKSPVACKEEKCILSGDDYHEFVFNW